MFHHRRTHLHIAGAEQQKLNRIFPCADAADTGDGNFIRNIILRNSG